MSSYFSAKRFHWIIMTVMVYRKNVIWSWFANFDCKGRSSEINMFMWNLCLFQRSYQLVIHSLQTYKQRPRNNKNTYVWVVSYSYENDKAKLRMHNIRICLSLSLFHSSMLYQEFLKKYVIEICRKNILKAE